MSRASGPKRKPAQDRPFVPTRVPADDTARGLVASVIEQLESYERAEGLRVRARRPADQRTFEAAVAALACDVAHRSLSQPDGWISVPLTKRVLARKDRYRHEALGKALPNIVKRLASKDLGLFHLEIGGRNPFLPGGGMQSRVRATTKYRGVLVHRGISLGSFRRAAPDELIILKAAKTGRFALGKKIAYEDTETTRAYRRDLETINEALSAAEIEIVGWPEGEIDLSQRTLRRVFNAGSFERGGRLFGGFWQDMKASDRHTLRINGQQLVELDFREVGPRILYGIAGVQPEFEDSYLVPGLEAYREGVKKVFNAMVHAARPSDRLPANTRPLFSGRHSARDIQEAVRRKHQAIAHLLFADQGLKLFFVESQIMVSALLSLIGRSVVALPIHDALLAPLREQDQVREAMLDSFHRIAGVKGEVRISPLCD